MGGAQPLAATMAGASMLAIECRRAASRSASRRATSTCGATTLDEALELHRACAHARRKPVSVGLLGNAAEILPEMVRRGVRPDMRHRPDVARTIPSTATCPPAGRSSSGANARKRSGAPSKLRGARSRWREHVRGDAGVPAQGIPTFDYGNNIRQVAFDEGVKNAFDFPGFVPAYVRPLFCEGIGPFRWVALSGDPEDIYRDRREGEGTDPGRRAPASLARHGARAHPVPGTARAHLLGGPRQRHRARPCVQRDGARAASSRRPIVIGRDHLDSGSVASPNRETEAMKDGSDAVADWPLLNALLNTASGATWVSIHHGGGVGIGYSQHSGVVIVLRRHRRRSTTHRARAVERPGDGRDAPRGRRLRHRRAMRSREQPEPALPRLIRVRTLWRHLSLLTCDDDRRVIPDAAIVTVDDTIDWVGAAQDAPDDGAVDRTIELAGRWVTPGLIDCHTHLVFAGQRAAEFARRTAGTSYADIAREGGGILNTMRATRGATVADLVRQSAPRLRALLQEGVTTVEIKSGYGLDFDSERRMLQAARELGSRYPVTVVTSLLAAHATPPEFAGRADDYVATICDDWLPRFAREQSPHPNPLPLVREREPDLPLMREREPDLPLTREKEPSGLPHDRLVDMVDAYCDSIAFSAAQCARVFTAAKALGWPVRLHAEQISNIGASRMAAQHGALACDHLEYATDDDAAALAHAGTVAVLLPVAYYVLADPRLPPLDAFRRHGVAMAVASDANPGSAPGASLLTAMNMARRLFGLSSSEVLDGVTRNAARALGLAQRHGQIAAGFRADFAAWSIETPDELGYWIGYNPCSLVVRGGEIVLERNA